MIVTEKREGEWFRVFEIAAAFLAVELCLSAVTGVLLYSGI